MLIKELVHNVNIPEGVSIDSSSSNVKVTGPRGELSRNFEHTAIKLEQADNKLKIIGNNLRKKEKALIGTWNAHLSNMVKGVNQGFLYEMKIIFAHFPMKVVVKGNIVSINNFLGEKASRSSAIVGDVKVNVKGDAITIEGNNVEEVGQTAGNLEKATIVKGRDTRVFQDGIYVISKGVAQ
ncbi:MAG TPA: 50S ribosomal protein L6 [Candidatus Poseidoniia archaeon]|jgi:large subunit ribosomal protein L6|nr:50S ribosomal protein L6 [Candidatus Poseidoniia archaeon]|tara:strand:- start:1493 stop:2035 length:543 start_codon:yes stop_codon:yes gene_type:complete